MDFPPPPQQPIIIGAGIAGLLTALHLAPLPCHVITMADSLDQAGHDSASGLAQGGIAAALDANDSPTAHARDTIAAGAGLTDPEVAARVTAAATEVIETLQHFGARFDKASNGALRLGLEGGHRARRIVHAADHTGAEIMRALTAAVCRAPHITVWPSTRVAGLEQTAGHITALSVQRGNSRTRFATNRVVLATGGIGGLFKYTTNPPTARGHGIALAARAGARIADLELLQFHPTALALDNQQLPLISEAVRGEGVALVDGQGTPILDDALATRDIVARAVWRAGTCGRDVFLATDEYGGSFSRRFPTIAARCRRLGIDPDLQPIPVRVAAHYAMGGVVVDKCGRSSVGGLWAVGEVARTGLHGANRLASNSLLEAGAYAMWVANDVKSLTTETGNARGWKVEVFPTPGGLPQRANARHQMSSTELRLLMWQALGLERDEVTLRSAIGRLEPLAITSDDALVALLMARGALAREESIGAHWRHDSRKHVEWSASL